MRDLTSLASRHGLTDRRILVTGGAGFVGGHLATALAPNNRIRVLDDFSNGSPSNVPDTATVIDGDVRDGTTIDRAIDGVDLIFHEAALVSVDRSVSEPTTSHETNVTATLNLLDRARREDARVVLASSAAIYGNPLSVPIDETTPKRPLSPYGIEKLAADHYARVYDDLYDLQTVSLRYFNIYGDRHHPSRYSGVIRTFLERARRDRPLVVYGDGTQTRDFVHIDDIVAANLLAATTDRTGEAYNVGSGTSVSINELATLILDITGSCAGYTHESGRAEDIDRSRADIEKARTELGYEPRISLSDGLAALRSEASGTPT